MISLIHFIQSTEQARNLTIWGQAKKAAWALLFLDTGGKAMHCPHRSGQRGHVLGPRVVRSSTLDVTDRLSRRLQSSGKSRYDLGLLRNAHHISHTEEQDPSHSAPELTPPSEGTPYILGQNYDLFRAWNPLFFSTASRGKQSPPRQNRSTLWGWPSPTPKQRCSRHFMEAPS